MQTDEGAIPRDGHVPAGYERWSVRVAAGTTRATSPDEWTGALVIVERGSIEVVCDPGARRTFGRGSYLCLSWLPVVCLRNAGPEDALLAAYRRAGRGGTAVAVPYPP